MCNLFPIPERSKEKIHPNSINKFEPVLDPDTHRSGQFKLTLTRVWIKFRRPAELLSFNVVKLNLSFLIGHNWFLCLLGAYLIYSTILALDEVVHHGQRKLISSMKNFSDLC